MVMKIVPSSKSFCEDLQVYLLEMRVCVFGKKLGGGEVLGTRDQHDFCRPRMLLSGNEWEPLFKWYKCSTELDRPGCGCDLNMTTGSPFVKCLI